MANSGVSNATYFRSPSWLELIGVPAGLSLMICAAFRPDLLPYAYLAPIKGTLLYLVNNHSSALKLTCYITGVIHIFEALYAFSLARSKGIHVKQSLMWGAQTFIMGVCSLRILKRFKSTKDSQ